ncbi:hypothetical protein JOC36_001458 [Weissella uvarum]|uniref:hypothetical protein n=1 Tax=Weissella uvarum TaxID=1479233 RepID=UPI001961A256|nr:hypothetical protein [Weissella uvarum]MBM7617865.1 hypothetical protein [Weissella uvarum]MCM0596137.1 hypothetical protein [Weissella uvarum]
MFSTLSSGHSRVLIMLMKNKLLAQLKVQNVFADEVETGVDVDFRIENASDIDIQAPIPNLQPVD